MTIMFNSKHFIKEIQSRPCLWNLNVKEYNDKIARQSAWEEIAPIMYQDWADLDAKEKTAKIRDLQKKWKGMRDYFIREKNRDFKKSECVTRKKRKTPFLDMLSFLNVKKKPSVLQNRPTTDTFLGTDLENSNSFIAPVQENTRVTATHKPTIQETIKSQKDDPDRNFLLSILPDMKTMTPSQNFEFRFEVMTLIKNMKYNQHNTDYYYSGPGPSSFAHMEPEYKSTTDHEVDPISNESMLSSPEDVKTLLQTSPNSSPSN